MAHNLNETNGKISFASTQRAWHGLGQIVDSAMTSKQAIELAGLDYQVIKTPMLAKVRGAGKVVVPDHFATVRKDTNEVLGVVGRRYEIIQNQDAFVFFDAIVGQGQAIFETAGALGNGNKTFITAKMPSYVRITGTDDITEMYVVLTNTHDGSGSVIAAVTGIRIVCENTMRIALKNTVNKVAIRHTTNAERNLAQAHKLLGISNDYITKMNEAFNSLALKKITDAKAKQLIENLFYSEKNDSTRIKNIRESVLESYYSGIGQEKVVGTAFGLLNGITHYTSHVKEYKDADTKFENLLMDGASAKITDKAFELLLAM
jgi:phage/plasmid-like protein (TIGR03299 family)